MHLEMPVELAEGYKSPSQRARVITEGWARENLYCACCSSPRLTPSPPNTRVFDFACPQCAASFQLKSQGRPLSTRIVDAAYQAMRHAVEESRAPHFLVLHYDLLRWTVQNVILIPSFALTVSSLERRKPLAPTARRKGWVGCNILLANIPADARIPLVDEGTAIKPRLVRGQYLRLQPLERMPYEVRGWALDVLNVVRSLDKAGFSLAEVYHHSDQLQRLHPRNLHVREKIRQQLQRLRDIGLVEFAGSGRYLIKAYRTAIRFRYAGLGSSFKVPPSNPFVRRRCDDI